MKKVKILLFTLLFLMLCSIVAYGCAHIFSKDQAYLTLSETVLYPKDVKGKLPTVFLAHNGGADRTAWGDFPQRIADAGFCVVNISYTTWDTSNVEAAISYSLKEYKSKIDTNRVAFVGGCHGGKELLTVMSKDGLDYTVKTAVALSISEDDAAFQDVLKKAHPPILAAYSTQDELGAYYQDVTKRVAEQLITEPKKVLSLDETAHGNDLLTKSPNKVDIGNKIIDWLKVYLVK
ncbi:MAG: hypothetical protein Q8942_20845 [Bacillota bacterium]|nr:hypothetical protein [Bacillota bacterium]